MAENIFLFIPNIIGKFDVGRKRFRTIFSSSNAEVQVLSIR